MQRRELNPDELSVLESISGPPPITTIRTTNVWIVEWLLPGDQQTGHLLHEWLHQQKPGWSAYFHCDSKADVLTAIEKAAADARRLGIVPIVHLESHGCETHLEGPCGANGVELLTWDELADPLQSLNLATGCNLIVLVAACTGFAGVQAFYKGPRAPAVALVGPTNGLTESELLNGTKEFYRRMCDTGASLNDIVISASRETNDAAFEVEPFATLAFEATIESLLICRRPEEYLQRKGRIRRRLQEKSSLTDTEIESRLSLLPSMPTAEELQLIWDTLFMIDVFPENRNRFWVDMEHARASIVAHFGEPLPCSHG